MHDTASAAALSQLLNQFSVPMFAVERSGPYSTFRFACLNDAMATTGQQPVAEILGKSAFDILPMQEAEVANGRYLECALTRSVVRFRDRFTTDGRRVIWDTTLQFVELPNSAERVLGTSIQLGAEDATLPEAVTFEDIQYISTMADIAITRNGRDVAVLQPEKRIYPVAQMPTTEAAIDQNWRRDLYVVIGDQQESGGWAVRIFVKPFANWIWGGAIIMALGGVVSLTDRRWRVGAAARKKRVASAGLPAE